ncbi:hypothetical protein KBZ20_11500 [Vulcanococcus limneticus Candia 3F8]|uniref:hypothetical protein n=1 Tax=Vulcanococcus limneticus TaxID=2170428 RepID=UPI0020CE126B|nr:hypothetical protein [Vulcanococcus limneticus]MCP9894395.1 hypothetical protein [Vulcanococcus limneticus Candia 3F8]
MDVDLTHRVTIQSKGRSGDVIVGLDELDLVFWWEFGGGTCVAIIHAPSPEEWLHQHPLNRHPRSAFLQALAAELRKLQCPGCSYEVTSHGILFHEPGSP